MENRHTNFSRAVSLFSKLGMRVWRLFSSLQLAVILVLILSVFGLISIVIVQVPSGINANSTEYALWIENVARLRFGEWTGLMAFLRLFDVMHSPLFLFAGILLTVNIIICSVNRWKARISALSGGRIRQPDEFYQAGSTVVGPEGRGVTAEQAALLLSATLKKHRYRVREENSSPHVYFAADKNRYTIIGSYFIHISIIILITGFLVGNYFGFRNPSFIVSEGTVREVGYGTNLSLRLESFEDEYWSDGTPKDYRSQVIIYEGGREVERGLVRVNDPLAYHGVRFYQSFFGPAVSIEASTAGNKLLYSGSLALPMQVNNGPSQYPMGILNIPEAGLTIYVVGSELNSPGRGNNRIDLGIQRGAGDAGWIKLGEGEYGDFEGVKFGFTGTGQYSGFQVSRDPGISLIWIGSGLFLLGLGMAFFLPYRRLWAFVKQGEDGKSSVLIKAANTAASEFQDIINELSRQFTNTPENSR